MSAPAVVISSDQAPTRPFRAIGLAGAALAFVILGASILLRLTTGFWADALPVSGLPSAAEGAIRLVHRLAASGVGLLALAAAILCWTRRGHLGGVTGPTAWIAAATLALAVIGPLTPGYRYTAVTVANVVGGTVLLMAFWWLHETQEAMSGRSRSLDALMAVALVVFVAHAGSGAAASAFEVRGVRWVAFIHAGTAMLATMFIGAILWEQRTEGGLDRVAAGTALLLAAQLALGMATFWVFPRPAWMGFLHAMLALPLAAGLVSIALRRDGRAGAPGPGYVSISRRHG